MKPPLAITLILAGVAASAFAEITPFAQYNLGEQDLASPPLDSSGNGRDFLSQVSQESINVGTGGEIAAPASTAFLKFGFGGYFNGPFAELDSEDFAVGVYARALANLVAPGRPAHVFQTGNRNQTSVRISLAAGGWIASYEPIPVPEAGEFISIGTPAAFVPDVWVHLAVIRRNGATTFYVDGIAQGDPETTIRPAHGDSAHLGINPGGAASFEGDIDAVRALTFTPDESVENIIAALQGVDSEPDGLFDDFEQRIVDATFGDPITDISLVLPGDDFDGDSLTNLEEQNGVSDPTDPNDPPPPLSTELELLAFWDFNEPIDLDQFIADDLTGEIPDLIAEYGLYIQELLFTEDGGGFSGAAGDFALDFTNRIDPETGEAGLVPFAIVDEFSSRGNDFLDVINSSTGDDRLVVSFWQRFDSIAVSSSFTFETPFSGVSRRGMNAIAPLSDGRVIFDHVIGGNPTSRSRLSGSVPDVDGTPFDFFPYNHYLFVKDGEIKEVFINGNRVLSGGGSGFTTSLINLTIGSDSAPGAGLIDGTIDDFAIFNLKPSDAQIAALAAGVSPIDVLNVVATPPSTDFIDAAYTRDGDILTLIFDSSKGAAYLIKYSFDLENFENELAVVPGSLDSTETTFTIDLRDIGIENEKRVFFLIELDEE